MCTSSAEPKRPNGHAFEMYEKGGGVAIPRLTASVSTSRFCQGHMASTVWGRRDHDMHAVACDAELASSLAFMVSCPGLNSHNPGIVQW